MAGTTLLIDSGAWSAFSRNVEIDINEYAKFCNTYQEVDNFVSLDVIPPRRGKHFGCARNEVLEDCAKRSFDNFVFLADKVGLDKIVPVYHCGTDVEWIEKYLELGVTYLGIGAVARGGLRTHERAVGSRELSFKNMGRYLLNADGTPRVRYHGFGITDIASMKAIPWYSVDSSSWVQLAAYGKIWAPRLIGGEYRYDMMPLTIGVSPKPALIKKCRRDSHVDTMTPTIRRYLCDYLSSMGLGLGSYELVEANGRKRIKGELWWDKSKTKLMRITERGVATSHQRRLWANARYIRNVNRVLPITHIFLAGAEGGLIESVEMRLEKRMMSYVMLLDKGRGMKHFLKHLESKEAEV